MGSSYVLLFFPVAALSSGNHSLFLAASFFYNEQSHFSVFQKTSPTVLRLLHEQKVKDIQNHNILICLGILKVSWEIQLKTAFCTFDVTLCATFHSEFSHEFEIQG